MPFTYRIEPTVGMLFVVGEGVITQADRLDTMRAWLSGHAYRPTLNTRCDVSAAASAPSLSELKDTVACIREHAAAIGRKKLAVVTGGLVAFGVARQFRALVGSDPPRMNREPAKDWLTGNG
jgi:hypothetical protein